MIVRGSRCRGQGNLPSLAIVIPATARLSPSKVTIRLAPDVRQSRDGYNDVQGLPLSEVNRLISSVITLGLEWVLVSEWVLALASAWVLASVSVSEWVLALESAWEWVLALASEWA
jgi:hypothetical protein